MAFQLEYIKGYYHSDAVLNSKQVGGYYLIDGLFLKINKSRENKAKKMIDFQNFEKITNFGRNFET